MWLSKEFSRYNTDYYAHVTGSNSIESFFYHRNDWLGGVSTSFDNSKVIVDEAELNYQCPRQS